MLEYLDLYIETLKSLGLTEDYIEFRHPFSFFSFLFMLVHTILGEIFNKTKKDWLVMFGKYVILIIIPELLILLLISYIMPSVSNFFKGIVHYWQELPDQ